VKDTPLRIIPLGGLGEIGRNMLVFEYGDDLMVIDAGLMFPENHMLGVDVVLPDMSYLYQRAERVRGIVITHGHEDHIGALPYLLERVHAPLYATALTRGLIEAKLPASQVHAAEMHTIAAGERLALGPFGVTGFAVSHSIPDGLGLAIETPLGLIVHSGDFKFDHNPADGKRTDFARLAALGGQGVLLLLSDSTNAEQAGYTPSESVLGETLNRIIAEAQGRVIVASFASNISRIQQVIDASARLGRRVAFLGRSMVRNVKVARALGYLNVDDDALLTMAQIDGMDPARVTIICTGSQGEPTSALVQMGQDQYRALSVHPSDTIVVSASPIPGNEETVNRTLDALFRLGATVFYDEVLDVHVSGHASQEEQKLMLNLVRPRYFVPIHGEYRHLVWHSKLAEQCGIPQESIYILESGDVLEIDAQGPRRAGRLAEGTYFVDGSGVAAMEHAIQTERYTLAHNGVLVVTVVLDKYSNTIVGEPRIESRGFMYEAESDGIAERIKAEITQAVARGGSRAELTQRMDATLKRMALTETGRRPLVVPILLKV
jgi:ribonuclease J